MDADRKYHVGLRPGEVAPTVLLPGDPARSELIAKHLEDAREMAFNREYRTFTGTADGRPLSVCSTGIGGASAAIALEELGELGATTFIRVGTCGATRPGVRVGELVVATAAVRSDATADAYVPRGYPAVADGAVVEALRQAAAAAGAPVHTGVVRSTDALYADLAPERLPRGPELAAELETWRRAGVLASDMETATVLVVGALRGWRAGSLLLCADEVESGEIAPLDPRHVERLIHVAVAAGAALAG